MPPWDPTQQQVAEADTLLMPDLTSLATLNADGGFIEAASRASQASAVGLYDFGAGKFTPAIKPNGTGSTGRFFFFPVDGLLSADEFTLEFWAMHPTLNWQSVAQNKTLFELETKTLKIPVRIGPSGGNGLEGSWVIFDVAAAPDRVAVSLNVARAAINFAAGVWVSVALTKIGSSLRVLLNGVDVGGSNAFNPDAQVTDRASGEGLRFGGSNVGLNSGFWISDIRVSRTKRTVGQTPTLRSLTASVEVDPTAVDRPVEPDVFGTLHHFHPANGPKVRATMSVMRNDKMISATPTKAGAPDATRPTLGQSGLYSYDFQLFDRWMAMLSDRDVKVWYGIASTPQILGGGFPPEGAELGTALSWDVPFNNQFPSDLTQWGHIVRDHLHHLQTLPVEVYCYGVWNEPDILSTYQAAWTQFVDLTEACCEAAQDVDPTKPIIIGEFADRLLGDNNTRLDELLDRVALGMPCDGFSIHDYSGDLRYVKEQLVVFNQRLALAGLAPGSIPLYVGEFNWSSPHMWTATTQDPLDDRLHIRAFTGAYTVAHYACQLNGGWSRSNCFSHMSRAKEPDEVGASGFDTTQLMSPSGKQWAPYNVMKGLMSTLGADGADLLETAGDDLPPGVYCAKAVHPDGTVGVALSSYGWANRNSRDVEIDLVGLTGEKRIRQWLVDLDHSSRWDNSDDPAQQELELVSDVTVSDPTLVSTDVPQWGSRFVLIEDAVAPPVADVPRILKIDGQLREIV